MRTVPLLLIPLLLAACAAPSTTADSMTGDEPVMYSCEDGTTLQVRFEGDVARVTLAGGEELMLPQQQVASGTSYGTPQHELRGKGDEAMWSVGRRRTTRCAVKR